MRRAAICGGADLAAAAAALGLEDHPQPEVVLLDAADPAAVARAARCDAAIPRVVVAGSDEASLLRACGVTAIAPSTEAHVLGPLLTTALPPRSRGATTRVLITSVRGGVGRTLLATNLARRLAQDRAVWLVDATGSGGVSWWLRALVAAWSDLEPLTGELTLEHLSVVAATPLRDVRVLGGAGALPSVALLRRTFELLDDAGALVIVDAPPLADERAAIVDPTTRRIVLSYADDASLAALDGRELGDAWLIASQAPRLPRHDVVASLPRDERSVADAMFRRDGVGGALGRAYDRVASLVSIDAS